MNAILEANARVRAIGQEHHSDGDRGETGFGAGTEHLCDRFDLDIIEIKDAVREMAIPHANEFVADVHDHPGNVLVYLKANIATAIMEGILVGAELERSRE